MKSNTYTVFEHTLTGLELGLQVHHIATYGLVTCAPDDLVDVVFSEYPEFDQIPVKNGQEVIGVLERECSEIGKVKHQMRNLDDGILVAANEPLLDFMPLMADIPFYRLVLTGSRINGIVTRSDLLKLPVRLLGFAMVTNLELMMQEVIQHQLPDDQVWMALLSNNRREKVVPLHLNVV
jgi:predicted transcriptional regulator